MSAEQDDEYFERVKDEIRAQADATRRREPLPRIDPPARSQRSRQVSSEGIERDRLDYAIGDLTGANYVEFVDNAFHALLKRPPDDAGSALQVHLLDVGVSKAEILGNLCWSPEGKRIGARVRGLLPRYALAKLGHVPIIGYLVEWGLALASLPMILRHQRAADTSVAARFHAAGHAQQVQAGQVNAIQAALAELVAEHDSRSRTLREDIQLASLRFDHTEQRVNELLHYVHAANHWMTSLQNSFAELESVADVKHARMDELAARIDESSADSTARHERHKQWAKTLAGLLPADGRVLDLGSDEGSWLEILLSEGIAVSGVETNRVLVACARERGLQISLGEPLSVLARCTDASLSGVTVGVNLLVASPGATTDLLREVLRVLLPGGYLLLRIESAPHGFARTGASDHDTRYWDALLKAAGFVVGSHLHAAGGNAVLVQRPIL